MNIRSDVQEIRSEVLIIGSEAAGAKAAIEAQEAGADVLIVTKGLIGTTGDTIMAGVGIQAPLGHVDPRDNPDVFFEDVVKGGDFLNNQKIVERLVAISVTEVPKLEKWGARFVKEGDKFKQVQYPGSSYPRGLQAFGFSGGRQWRRAFHAQFKRLNTKILEDVFITSLLKSKGEIAGAMGISLRNGKWLLFRSKITILATGGCPQIYRKTDSSRDATGDGMMMALHAGAELMDMEFQQFFPACCYTPPFEMAMFTATLRYRLHATFKNSLGESFMDRYLPLAKDWGLRDPSSRAIYLENMNGRGGPHGGAYLYIPEAVINDFIEKQKPPFVAKLAKAGIDIRKQALEVGPGAHYSMGGIRINEQCETGVPRLYAIGEVASGMDGAERIDGGPAITWCVSMGYIAGKAATEAAKKVGWPDIDVEQVEQELDRAGSLWDRKEGVLGTVVKEKIKDIMWNHCSLVRDAAGLQTALNSIQRIKSDDVPRLSVPGPSKVFNKAWVEALEAINMVDVSEIIVRAAMMRKESRKSHYRADFLKRDDLNWLRNIIVKKETGALMFRTQSPVMTKMRPPETGELDHGR